MQVITPAFTLLFGMPGGSEWILIVIVVLLMFGGKKIPELMRGLGKGVKEFKDAKNDIKNQVDEGMKEKEVKDTKDTTAPPQPEV